jgi:PPOX class probable F420-dependent enzyme
MLKPPRPMRADEIEALLARELPARLATLDAGGFPHITPLWFVWAGGAFVMTSIADRPHLRRIARDPRVGVLVDDEAPERDDGQRPNRQVRAVGTAKLLPDGGGEWTARITKKYLHGPGAARSEAARAADDRVVIRVVPARLVAVASV